MKKHNYQLLLFLLIYVVFMAPSSASRVVHTSLSIQSNQAMPCEMKTPAQSPMRGMREMMVHSSMATPHNAGCQCKNGCNHDKCKQTCHHCVHVFVALIYSNTHQDISLPRLNNFTAPIHQRFLALKYFRPPRPPGI